MPRPKMELWAGEKDGWETEMSPDDRPKVFYAVPHADEPKIGACKSTRAKLEMRDKLAILAYEFDPQRSSETRYLMVRRPALDRVPQH